jgi:thiamine-phosphate pyrophosphorylase
MAVDAAHGARPVLVLVTDSKNYGWDATQRVASRLCALARPGAVAVLLREIGAPVRTLVEQAQQLRDVTARNGQLLLVRDRLDVALWVNADGVHLGEHSVPACELQAVMAAHGARSGTELWITRAWHDVHSPPDPHASALLVAPVAAARKGRPALGAAGLQQAVKNAGAKPVYALGGMGSEHGEWLGESGAAGIAAIGSAYTQPDNLLRSLNALRG